MLTHLFAAVLLIGIAICGFAADATVAPPGDMPIYNVAAYGAVGDGKTLNTKAIQATVEACAAAGGGMVYIPGGIFVSGPIFLKSNIEFYLSAGAVLRGSTTFADYNGASLLNGRKCTNIAITGSGTLDGQGDAWWRAIDGGNEALRDRRPPLLSLTDCERARVEGIQLENSPGWTLVPTRCRNLTISQVSINNPWNAYHNNDGMDIVSCSNVRITDCHIDTGDDGIAIKSLPSPGLRGIPDYTQPPIPCEDIIITNCIVEHAHSGVAIWGEIIGGMRNITVSNCVFDGTRSGIKVSRCFPCPGGFVRDVRVDNIVMRRVEFVLEVSNYLDPTTLKPAPASAPDPETTPEFSNIHFSNITATQARTACEMFGLPKMPVRNISFSNIQIEADKGFDFRNVEDIYLHNVTVTCPGPALRAEIARNIELQRFTVPQPQANIPVIQFTEVSDAWIHSCTAAPGIGTFVGLVGEKNRNIVLDENRLANAKQAQASVEPVPTWSSISYAFCGSSLWRTAGDMNLFLPVPTAVWETIKREWSKQWVTWGINGIHRLESGAIPELVLAPGDKRRIYIITAWEVDEQLLILEDGTLLRKVKNFKWQM